MNKLIKYIFLVAIVAIFASCSQEVGDFTVNGESITGFELAGPNNNVTVKVNTGALTEPYTFTWGAAESGLDSPIKYTILFDRQDGDFSNPLFSKVSDGTGANTTATLTFQELKQIYTLGGNTGVVSVKWNVKAENGSPNVKMGKVANILKLALSSNGISDFTLTKPLNNSVLQFDGTYENDQLAFDWNDATATTGTLTYKLYIDKQDGNFSVPLLTIDADGSGKSSIVSKTHAQWKALFDQNKLTAGSYIWTVKAFSADLEWTNQTFQVFVEFVNWRKPIYIVGEATSIGWDIGKALEMNFIAPNIWAGAFELKAGKEFKFFPEKGSWDNGIGSDRFTTFVGCSDAGGNIKNSGTKDTYYFVIVDLNAKKLTVSDSPKILGGSVVADWNTGNAVPMQMMDVGIYETYQYITVDGWGFKFVPTKAGWDGDFGKSKTVDGALVQSDADNLTVTKNGFYRVRVNMNNMTYSVTETAWGIIGSATPGGWGEDTNMTLASATKGEYKWTADITLTTGEIKFRANDAWEINFGDFEDDGFLDTKNDNNIGVTAGNYHIELILNSETGFRYTLTKN